MMCSLARLGLCPDCEDQTEHNFMDELDALEAAKEQAAEQAFEIRREWDWGE